MSALWRQHIAVEGESLRLLEIFSNISGARRDPESNAVILSGDGPWFPEMRGLSWAAACTQRQPDDISLSDISPILRALLNATPIPVSDASSEDVATWLRGDAR